MNFASTPRNFESDLKREPTPSYPNSTPAQYKIQTTKAKEQIVIELRVWKKARCKEIYKGTVRVIPNVGLPSNPHKHFKGPAQLLKLIEDIRK